MVLSAFPLGTHGVETLTGASDLRKIHFAGCPPDPRGFVVVGN